MPETTNSTRTIFSGDLVGMQRTTTEHVAIETTARVCLLKEAPEADTLPGVIYHSDQVSKNMGQKTQDTSTVYLRTKWWDVLEASF